MEGNSLCLPAVMERRGPPFGGGCVPAQPLLGGWLVLWEELGLEVSCVTVDKSCDLSEPQLTHL